MKRILWTILVGAMLCFFLIAPAGCTVHFKGKEVELKTEANSTFELDKVDFFVTVPKE